MTNPPSPWPARADSALAAVLALWAGTLASAGLTAAVAFPAMKKLGTLIPGIPEAVPDHWTIAAGSIAQRVFEISDIAQVTCALLAVVLAIGRFARARRSAPRASATLLAAVIVAAGATGVSALLLTPSMTHRWADALEASRAGEVERVATIRQAFDRDHRLVSAVMQGTLFFTLAALAISVWTAPSAPPESRAVKPRVAKNAPAALPFDLPRVTEASRRCANEIYDALAARHPDAHCELNYSNPHELLVATILSAQATDAGVNRATPALFRAYPTPADFAGATPAEIEQHIRSIGLFRNKARAIVESMRTIERDFGGEVPRTMEGLLSLRGVARKTANVVLGNAFGLAEGVVVDTHVERVSKRFGLVPKDATVPMVERRLMALLPRERWTMISHLLIFHGRRVCKARGALCATDPVCRAFCSNARAGGRKGGAS